MEENHRRVPFEQFKSDIDEECRPGNRRRSPRAAGQMALQGVALDLWMTALGRERPSKT